MRLQNITIALKCENDYEQKVKTYYMCSYKTSKERLFHMEWSCVPFHNIIYDYHIILNVMGRSQMKATPMICIIRCEFLYFSFMKLVSRVCNLMYDIIKRSPLKDEQIVW
jgi:hypothetical protein